MALPLLAIGAGAAIGGLAGSFGQRQEQTRTVGPTSNLGAFLGGGLTGQESDELASVEKWWADNSDEVSLEERTAQWNRMQGLRHKRDNNGGELKNQYNIFSNMINAGPGQSDVATGTQSQRDLAALYQKYAEGGYRPGAEDISSSQSLAQQLFNPQRVAMQQAFSDQSTEANRRAALMGRSMNDPILAAKLAQEQTRQSSMLEANQGAWSTQYAMQQPMMRLGFQEQRAQTLQGLASQAMANRQALLSMGSNLLNSERNFQMGQGTTTTTSGGGWAGALTGAIGGIGTAMSAYGSMSQANYFDKAADQIGKTPPGGGTMSAGGAGGLPFSGGLSSNNFWSTNPYS